MNDRVDDHAPQPGLCLNWREMKADDTPRIWRGQLVVAMKRLVAIQREFLALGRQRDIQETLRHLELCIENYMLRAYEVRDRALGLLASRTHQAKHVEKLRHPEQRVNALSSLKSLDHQLTVTIERLLLLLDEDIKLRNLHTHSLYLSLGLDTGSDIFDVYDALDDVSNDPAYDPATYRKFKVRLRFEVQRMAQHYIKKADDMHKAIEGILNAAGHAKKGFPNV